MRMNLATFAVATALMCAGQLASAKDKLDNIIESGKLRCAVVLDFPTQADTILAVSQGKVDATIATSTVAYASIKSGKYDKYDKRLKVGGNAPYPIDYVSLVAARGEYGLIRYLNLFVNQQVRTGRYAELYKKWVGEGKAPELMAPGVYY